MTDISDHFLVFTILDAGRNKVTSTNKYKLRRKFTPENIALLQEKLDSVEWSDVYNTNENIDRSFNIFSDILSTKFYLDYCIPLRKYRSNDYTRIPKQPWVSKSILNSINRKNRLYVNYVKNRNENTRQKYTSYKNILTNTLRLAKKKYFAEQLNQFRNDIKNTWKVINSVLNRAKNTSSIAKLRVDDITIEDNQRIAENFNLYISQIGSNLAKTTRNITEGD